MIRTALFSFRWVLASAAALLGALLGGREACGVARARRIRVPATTSCSAWKTPSGA